MNYLLEYNLNKADLETLEATLEKNVKELVIIFPEIVKMNLKYIIDLGVNNSKEIFMGHAHMFMKNPDRFKNIFEKYDRQDLIRCLEKNASIIEKL